MKKICPRCGIQNDDSSIFCENCGAKLGAYNNSASSAQNPANTVHTNFRPGVRYSRNPVINEIKKIATSPLMIISALALSLMIIVNISGSEAIGVSVMGYLKEAFETVGIYELKNVLSVLNGVSRFFIILGMLPHIITAVGICMTIYSAFDKTNDMLSVSGLKAIRVVNSIILVLNTLSTISFFFGGIWLLSKINEVMGKLPFLIVFVMLIAFAIMLFEIFYVKKIIDFIDDVISSIQSKMPIVPSRFIGVMMFICGGAYAILALMFSGSQNWFGAITYICLGLTIFSYVNKMCYLRDRFKIFTENKSESEQVNISGDQSKVVSNIQNVNANQIKVVSNIQEVGQSSLYDTKKIAIAGIILAVIVAIVATMMTYTAPGVDKDIVGKWSYGDSSGMTLQFKRNGVFIGNEGTDYEEKGTYTADDGVIYIVVDGNTTDHEYKVIDSDEIQIYRSYIASNWERKYYWQTLYRVK